MHQLQTNNISPMLLGYNRNGNENVQVSNDDMNKKDKTAWDSYQFHSYIDAYILMYVCHLIKFHTDSMTA